jgi:hypothetical protein
MGEIATYKCSNLQCRLTLRLAGNFPVWDEARKNIIRYRNETFCTSCNKVVEYNDANACTVCFAEVTGQNIGRVCPRCAAGTFTMPLLSVL